MKCLKRPKLNLEFIRDADMYVFFEKGTRSGISHISNKYSKANNKYLKSYHPKEEWEHIIYLYASNLCVYAISKFPPTSGFKWIDPKEFDMNKYTSNSSKVCVFKVDCEYPKELWELHNDCPLPTNEIEIKREILSDYQLKLADTYNIPIKSFKISIKCKKSTTLF